MSNGHDRNYEAGVDREINLKGIVYTTGALAALVIVSMWLMLVMSRGFRGRLEAADPPPPVLPEARIQQPPSGARLQADPEGEMEALRHQEDAVLYGYSWVDESTGVAQVPIQRAMELLAEDGS